MLSSVLMAFGAIEVGVRALHFVPDRFWEPDPVRGARLIVWPESSTPFMFEEDPFGRAAIRRLAASSSAW
jgi:hypothetical protein